MVTAAAAIAGCGTEAKITLGAPAPADLPGLITLVNALAAEPGLLFIMPIDPVTGPATLKDHLAAIALSGNEAVFVARVGGAPVGLVTGTRGTHPARRGVVEIGIGVGAPHRGRGIGAALMTALESWARDRACHRLQLTVGAANAPAIALYLKLGFIVEGSLRAAATVAGKRVDELLMAKLLD